MRLMLAIIASIVLLITEYRSERLMPVRATLSIATDSLKYLVDLPISVFENASEALNSYSTLKTENTDLRQKQLIHKTQLLKFEALEKENIRLRALLENSFKLGEQVLIAELLSI